MTACWGGEVPVPRTREPKGVAANIRVRSDKEEEEEEEEEAMR